MSAWARKLLIDAEDAERMATAGRDSAIALMHEARARRIKAKRLLELIYELEVPAPAAWVVLARKGEESSSVNYGSFASFPEAAEKASALEKLLLGSESGWSDGSGQSGERTLCKRRSSVTIEIVEVLEVLRG